MTKLVLEENMNYDGEKFPAGEGPYEVGEDGDIPEEVAERVEEMNKGEMVDDFEEEDFNEPEQEEEEEVESEDITFEKEDEDEEDISVTVEESGPVLDPGVYEGEITSLSKRTVDTKDGDEATYLDISIKTEGESGDPIEVTAGYPLNVTRRTMLGKMLKRFKQNLKVDKKLHLSKTLKDTKVQFQVKENEDGYSEVIRDTVRPA